MQAITIRTGDWATLGADAASVRTAVFIEEQGVPVALEWDAADSMAIHAVAYNIQGRAVATGRLLASENGIAKIGRMAVHGDFRGLHIGQAILKQLMHMARQRGDTEAMLYAQRSAEGFYQRLGYQVRGKTFEDAGMPHIEMFQAL